MRHEQSMFKKLVTVVLALMVELTLCLCYKGELIMQLTRVSNKFN